jgi:hypothetical protein
VANSNEQLLLVLAQLEQCRAMLLAGGNKDSADLVGVAVLDLRTKLSDISEEELKALCDELLPDDVSAERSREAKSLLAQRRRPLLRVVK